MKTILLTLSFCLFASWTLNAAAAGAISPAGEVETVTTNPVQIDMQARHHKHKAHPAKRHHAHRAGVQ